MPRIDERQRTCGRLETLSMRAWPEPALQDGGSVATRAAGSGAKSATAGGGADADSEFDWAAASQDIVRVPGKDGQAAGELDSGQQAGALTPEWLEMPPEASGWRARLIPERLRGARINLGGRGAAALAAVGAVAALATAALVLRGGPALPASPPVPAANVMSTAPKPVTSTPTPGPAAAGELVVSVVGVVNHPGLVRVPPGARVADVIAAAGGLKDGADLLRLNMAARVSDGEQIVVVAAGSAAVPGGPSPPPVTGGDGKGGVKVDLNTSTVEQLDALPGVGPITAAAVLMWRKTNGRFTSVEQLGEVDGIGPARLARLRALVTV